MIEFRSVRYVTGSCKFQAERLSLEVLKDSFVHRTRGINFSNL